jgi:hypothetical protein
LKTLVVLSTTGLVTFHAPSAARSVVPPAALAPSFVKFQPSCSTAGVEVANPTRLLPMLLAVFTVALRRSEKVLLLYASAAFPATTRAPATHFRLTTCQPFTIFSRGNMAA